jgi:membrane-associated phospholipid phosphatase
LQIAIVVMLSLVAIAAVIVTYGESLVLRIDRPIYFDWWHAGRDVTWWGPSWFYEFGRFPLTVIVPVVVFLVAFLRSRVVAFAYPLVIAIGGAVYTILRWLVNRLRPPRSGFPGEHTSFPGGHSIEVALVLLPLPLVVWSLTRNKVLRALGVVVPIAVWADTELNIIRIGDHWPVDHAAGLLIAASLLIAFYCVVLSQLREERSAAATC